MKKALGFRLMDGINEIMDLEAGEAKLVTALYLRETDEKIQMGMESLEASLKAQAGVYNVKFDNYANRIEEIKNKYLQEIEKLRKEYEFQFVNLQLELREALANQKIALVNAKKVLDIKKEFVKSAKYRDYVKAKKDLVVSMNNAVKKSEYDKYYKMISKLVDPTDIYDQKRKLSLKKYEEYDSIIKSCEAKIQFCINETYTEIEKITKENIENMVLVKKENPVMKVVNKLLNMISGKSKFETKINSVEVNVNNLISSSNEKIEKIKKNTIKMVEELQVQKDKLNVQTV